MNFKWVRCDLLINNNRVLCAGICKENPLASLRVHITFAQPYNWWFSLASRLLRCSESDTNILVYGCKYYTYIDRVYTYTIIIWKTWLYYMCAVIHVHFQEIGQLYAHVKCIRIYIGDKLYVYNIIWKKKIPIILFSWHFLTRCSTLIKICIICNIFKEKIING